jgi:hypothetical protein
VIATTVQPKGGRPSDYCAEIAMTICDRLADGESLRAICADAEMPDKVRNSDDSDQPFQRIPISHSDRSRSDWRECAVGCIC